MKVTRINDNQLAITLPTGRAFTIGRLDGLGRITFDSKDDLNAMWDLLAENADELGATTGPKTAELEMLSERIDALEKAKEAKLDYEDLDLRVGTLKGDIERQDRRMAKLEELIELVRDDDDRLARRDRHLRYGQAQRAKTSDHRHHHGQALLGRCTANVVRRRRSSCLVRSSSVPRYARKERPRYARTNVPRLRGGVSRSFFFSFSF